MLNALKKFCVKDKRLSIGKLRLLQKASNLSFNVYFANILKNANWKGLNITVCPVVLSLNLLG